MRGVCWEWDKKWNNWVIIRNPGVCLVPGKKQQIDRAHPPTGQEGRGKETIPRRLRLLLGGGGGVGGCGEVRPRWEMSTSTSDTVSPEGFMEQACYSSTVPKAKARKQKEAESKQGTPEVHSSQKVQDLTFPRLESPQSRHLRSQF